MKKIIAALGLGLLTGCTTTSQDSFSSITPSINTSNSDEAIVKLAEAARSVSQSLNELKAIEKASNPPVKPMPYPTSSGLVNIIASVDWSGPIEPLMEHIAKLAKYNLQVIGRRPSIPVLVTIMSPNTPLAYIIRDANLQAGTKADINVYPGNHTIELRYAKN